MIFNMNGVNYDTQIKPNKIVNLHVWSMIDSVGNVEYLADSNADAYTEGIFDEVDAHIELSELKSGLIISQGNLLDSYVTWDYGDCAVSNDGALNFNGSGSTRIYVNDKTDFKNHIGRYVRYSGYYSNATTTAEVNKIYYIPDDATVTYTSTGGHTLTVDKYYEVVGVPYSYSGECKYIGRLGGGAKIVYGSYIGNGNYKEANANKLSFDFAPKVVMIVAFTNTNTNKTLFTPTSANNKAVNVMIAEALTTSYVGDMGFTYSSDYESYGKKSADGKTVYWYNPTNASYQLNSSGYTYYYIAIG